MAISAGQLICCDLCVSRRRLSYLTTLKKLPIGFPSMHASSSSKALQLPFLHDRSTRARASGFPQFFSVSPHRAEATHRHYVKCQTLISCCDDPNSNFIGSLLRAEGWTVDHCGAQLLHPNLGKRFEQHPVPCLSLKCCSPRKLVSVRDLWMIGRYWN